MLVFTRTRTIYQEVDIDINNADKQCIKQYNKVAKTVIISISSASVTSVWRPRLTSEDHVPDIEADVGRHSLVSSAGESCQGIFIVNRHKSDKHRQTQRTANVISLLYNEITNANKTDQITVFH